MIKIRFSAKAISDLQQTKTYICNELCNEQAAISTVNKILERIRILQQFPKSGTPLSSIVPFETNYRFLVCGNYVAFYRYEKGTVSIIRILYGRRDFMQALFETPTEED